MRIYQFYTTLGQANACNIQIISRGVIRHVLWEITEASGGAMANRAELSFQAASQLTTHNPNGIISAATFTSVQVSAVAVYPSMANIFHGGLDIRVDTGVIIYLNSAFSGSGTFKALMAVEE